MSDLVLMAAPFVERRFLASDREYLAMYRLWQGLRTRLAHENLSESDCELATAMMLALRKPLEAFEKRNGDSQRIGPWIPTPAGKRLWIRDPRPQDISLADIAYVLSRIPRYNGMTRGEPYSVAQHLVLCSFLVPPRLALHALLHDAQEYVVMDIITPLKRILGSAYDHLEWRLQCAIEEKLGLRWTELDRAVVKAADNKALATEVRDLTFWGVVSGDFAQMPLRVEAVRALPWREAFRLFVVRLNSLCGHDAVTTSDMEWLLGEEGADVVRDVSFANFSREAGDGGAVVGRSDHGATGTI